MGTTDIKERGRAEHTKPKKKGGNRDGAYRPMIAVPPPGRCGKGKKIRKNISEGGNQKETSQRQKTNSKTPLRAPRNLRWSKEKANLPAGLRGVHPKVLVHHEADQ